MRWRYFSASRPWNGGDHAAENARLVQQHGGLGAAAPAAYPNAPQPEIILIDTKARSAMRWAMALFYAAAGIVHLTSPDAFLPIVPDWVPAAREVILITGVCELAGAAALLTRNFRRAAGAMLALYAVCVFPANVKHAVYDVQIPGLPTSWWYHAPRLALQPVIVWWALYCSGLIDWPMARRGERP